MRLAHKQSPNVPSQPLGCPGLLIGSLEDRWMRADDAGWRAPLASGFVDAGALGHINAASGLAGWQTGLEWLQLLYDRAHNEQPAMFLHSRFA